jgi:hypothetical protein
MKDEKLKLRAKWLKEEVQTFNCFQHDVNNDQTIYVLDIYWIILL